MTEHKKNKCDPQKMKKTISLGVKGQRLDRGPDLTGYTEWKSAMSSEACLSSEVKIHEVSLLVPSYPVQWMRIVCRHKYGCLSILESRISEISNSSSSSMVIGRGGD